MTVKIRAQKEFKTRDERLCTETFLLEISPQRVAQPLSGEMFSVPLPWTYVICFLSQENTYGYGQSPSLIMGAHQPISSIKTPLGVPPLFAVYSTGSFCPGTIAPRLPRGATEAERLLACIRAALFTTAGSGYAPLMIQNPSFGYLRDLAGLKSNPDRRYGMALVKQVYSYWESLEEFPSTIPLEYYPSVPRFPELLSTPVVLVE